MAGWSLPQQPWPNLPCSRHGLRNPKGHGTDFPISDSRLGFSVRRILERALSRKRQSWRPIVKRRDAVWITGLGAATPLGSTYETVAKNLLEGKSGVCAVSRFDVTKHHCKIFAPIPSIPLPPTWDESEFRCLDPYEQMLSWCAIRALHDPGWWERRQEIRLGLVLGLGGGWLGTRGMVMEKGGKMITQPSPEQPSI